MISELYAEFAGAGNYINWALFFLAVFFTIGFIVTHIVEGKVTYENSLFVMFISCCLAVLYPITVLLLILMVIAMGAVSLTQKKLTPEEKAAEEEKAKREKKRLDSRFPY